MGNLDKKSFEDGATLTPIKSPKIGGHNVQLALSPIALQEYQTEQESHISSLTEKLTKFEAKDAINSRELKDMKVQLADAREYHEELIEQMRQQGHEYQKNYFLEEVK